MSMLVELGPARKVLADVRETFGLALPDDERAKQIRDLDRGHAMAVAGGLEDLARDFAETRLRLKQVWGNENRATGKGKTGRPRKDAPPKVGVSETPTFSKQQKRHMRALASVPDEIVTKVFEEAAEVGDVPSETDVIAAHKKQIKADDDARAVADREAKRQAAEDTNPHDDRVVCCAIADYHQHVAAGSLDAIVTDPPYLKEYLPVYRDLAAFAAHALRPGGLLMAIAPHPHLPAVFDYMDLGGGDGLAYRWMLAYYQPQARQQVHSAKVTVQWKPWIAYTRAGGQPDGYSTDFVEVGRWTPDRQDTHHWGQTESGIAKVIGEWVKRPSLICDPFCGGGSTLTAALKLGHRVIGADIDAANVALTKERIR